MRKSRRALAGILATAMAVSLAACGGAPTGSTPQETEGTTAAAQQSSAETVQTYEGKSQGFGGEVVASVTVDEDGTITDIQVSAESETPDVGGKAVEPMIQAILEAQSIEVDCVSGATITSDAIRLAVRAALEEAGILETASGENHYKAGTYQVEVPGRNAKIVMDVVFSEDAITDIQIVEQSETDSIASVPFERIPAQILEYQTLNVDAVTGATVTSSAIVRGVKEAVEQAGGSGDALMASEEARAKAGDPIEKTADVIVVGGGGAGMSAAVSALDEGASVILVEKTASLGGNTVLCGGAMNAADTQWASGFDVQAGEEESLKSLAGLDAETFPEEYREDFKTLQGQIEEYLAGGANGHFDSVELHTIQTYYYGLRTDKDGNTVYGDYKLVSKMTSEAMEAVEWLREKGVKWNDDVVTQPVGGMWRRGHNPSMPKGTEYVEVLGKYIAEKGEILYETAAMDLIIEDGRVTGVKAEQSDGTEVTLHASKGVILATGGFGSNLKMVQEYNNYWDDIPDSTRTTNASGMTGDGIVMAQKAGAALTGMEYAQMMPVSDPDTGDLFTGLIPQTAANYIMVNNEGRRFIDECEARDTLTQAAIENGGTFYLIADAAIAEECRWLTNWEEEVERGNTIMADSLEELGEALGFDAETTKNFVEEIEKYNSYVDAGTDPEYGKTTFNSKVLEAPFYATPRKPAIHHTMGGLVVDTDSHVLTDSGEVITGLYAAGEVTGGIHAGNRLGGNAVADIMVFGKTAGANAAAEK